MMGRKKIIKERMVLLLNLCWGIMSKLGCSTIAIIIIFYHHHFIQFFIIQYNRRKKHTAASRFSSPQFQFIKFSSKCNSNEQKIQLSKQPIHSINQSVDPFNVALNSFPNVEYERGHLFETNRYFPSPICFWFLPKRPPEPLKCDNLGPTTVNATTHT